MLQFGTKTLLIVLSFSALWLSTASDFNGASDIRGAIFILLIVYAALRAYYSVGKPKAFWLGFAAIMVLMGRDSQPMFYSVNYDFRTGSEYDLLTGFNRETVYFGAALTLATIAGYIGTYIYDQSQKTDDA